MTSIINTSGRPTLIQTLFKKYMNTPLIEKLIRQKHEIPDGKFKTFTSKQARQIVFSLEQASHYMAAARTSPMQTKPLLLYYACCGFATAQMLYIGDGNHSLDRLANRYKSHGFHFNYNDISNPHSVCGLNNLSCDIRTGEDGRPNGLFGAWWELSGRPPIWGTTKDTVRKTTGTSIILAHVNDSPTVPFSSISLYEAISRVAGIYFENDVHGINHPFARGRVELNKEKNISIYTFTIHPTTKLKFAHICDQFLFEPNYHHAVNCSHSDNAGEINIKLTNNDDIFFRLPDITSISSKECLFSEVGLECNEFGFCYAGLYMLGMMSRYRPELWMDQFNERSEFILACEMFCDFCQDNLIRFTIQIFGDMILTMDS